MQRKDLDCLRRLAEEKAAVAALPLQRENAGRWRASNDLTPGLAPIFITELPWHEFSDHEELVLTCEDPEARQLEGSLRRELFSWRHFPGTMVVSGHMECPLSYTDSGIGMHEEVDIVRTDARSDIVSRHYKPQITGIQDIEKIKDPVIELDKEASQGRLDLWKRIFEPVLPVKQVGSKGLWFTPWDVLIALTGVEEAMTALVDDPDYIDALLTRYMETAMLRMNRYRELGIWSSNNDNTRVGSGGYGYTDALPDVDTARLNADPMDIWGCSNAQIFSGVSPQMSWEFALKYEMEWLSLFGLNYYGCCEPLHLKMDNMDRIPRLRKISMSPWADPAVAAPRARGKYVLSFKPNPAVFAGDTFSEERARADLRDMLGKAEGCATELIMKDVSTIRGKPEHVSAWSRIALETAAEFAP